MTLKDGKKLDNILSVSTAASNKFLFHFDSYHALTQWTAGIRLAMYEHTTLSEAYTGALIAGKGKTLNNIRMILDRQCAKYEDWHPMAPLLVCCLSTRREGIHQTAEATKEGQRLRAAASTQGRHQVLRDQEGYQENKSHCHCQGCILMLRHLPTVEAANRSVHAGQD
jgi:hypothetical protein